MIYTKQYWGNKKDGFRVGIRTNLYSRTLNYIRMLMEELAKDYSEDLRSDNVYIVVYGGDSVKGIMGIEFSTTTPSKNYTKIEEPEFLL